MKVLVTGASGFVGGAIARRLAADPGNRVFGAGRREPAGFGGSNVVPVALDVARKEDFARAGVHGPFEVIVHAAGLAHQFGKIEPAAFRTVNVGGTANAARFAAGTGARLVHVSSVSVYGWQSSAAVTEAAECRPADPYGISKLAAERAVAEEFGDGALILRLATVVGPGDPGNLSRLITQINRGRFVQVGPGRNRKTFVSVDDVAEIVGELVCGNDRSGGIYNVAAAPVTVGEVVSAIRGALGRKSSGFWVPAAPFALAGWANRRTLRVAVIEKASQMLGKWTAEDVFSGEKLLAERGLAPARDILSEIARETAAIAGHA